MLKTSVDLTVQSVKGLNTQPNILGLEKDQSLNMMNVKVNFDGSRQKRLGTDTRNNLIIADSAAAGFTPVATGSLTNNLQAFWAMNEAGGERQDNFGGHTLLDNNSVLYAGGIRNRAASFVASDSEYLLRVNTSTLATGDVDFSISTWLFMTSTDSLERRFVIAKKDGWEGNDSNTQLLLHFNESPFIDSSSINHTVINSGSVGLSTVNNKFGGGAGEFDGNFLQIADNPVFRLGGGAGNFSIDFQVRLSRTDSGMTFISQASDGISEWRVGYGVANSSLLFEVVSDGVTLVNMEGTWNPQVDTFYHASVIRGWNGSANDFALVIDGSALVTSTNSVTIPDFPRPLAIGFFNRLDSPGNYFEGYLDEIRVSNIARWQSDFTSPVREYGSNEYEYAIGIDTDQRAFFSVSSSGRIDNGYVRGTSFGALSTSNWYNVVAWHDTGDTIGISVNLSATTASYSSGVRSGSAPFVVGAVSNGFYGFFNGRIDETGFWKKVLTASERSDLYNSGNANSYQNSFNNNPWASFDFGASNLRWLMVSAGTGIYASSNLGVTWVNIATDRTANYQSFERSNGFLIATSEAQDNVLAWSGSANTFATILNNSAPLAKYAANFQGFLILLNSNTRKRGFYWEDEATQATGNWSDVFDIPSSFDDEITGSFILRSRFYVSTRRTLYLLTFIGGNPDWSFKKIKDWGYVSKTMKYIDLGESIGQVACGMTWDRKIRIFDGSLDQIISDNVEFDNRQCDFAMEKVSYSGSGPIVSFAETDFNENVYRLCVSLGADSTETTHFINYDGRIKGFYPDSNRQFNTMTMAESANRYYLMAFDRSGRCHMIDSGNRDANTTAIDDVYDSRLIFDKAPSQTHKSHKHDLFFDNTTSGTIHYFNRTNFKEPFVKQREFIISGTGGKHLHHESLDVPEGFNVYQYRITSSSGTNDPYLLMRDDIFVEGKGIGKAE